MCSVHGSRAATLSAFVVAFGLIAHLGGAEALAGTTVEQKIPLVGPAPDPCGGLVGVYLTGTMHLVTHISDPDNTNTQMMKVGINARGSGIEAGGNKFS